MKNLSATKMTSQNQEVFNKLKTKYVGNIESEGCKLAWDIFKELCETPRVSGNLEQVTGVLMALGEKYNLTSKIDLPTGDLLLTKKADSGYENRQSIVFQAHMVTVQRTNGTHDFSKDPIQVQVTKDDSDEEWLESLNGTTLGADNGMGLALAFAVLADRNLKTGQLELLCTTDEETTLGGAQNISADFFDSRLMVNVDSEESGELTISAAGGITGSVKHKYETSEITGQKFIIKVEIAEMIGGHSGIDIHEKRPNAIKTMASILYSISGPGIISPPTPDLISLEGGQATNAIPHNCTAIVSGNDKVLRILKNVEENWNTTRNSADTYLQILDNDVCKRLKQFGKFKVTKLWPGGEMDTDEKHEMSYVSSSWDLLHCIAEMPDGILKMSENVPGLVETSCNMGTVSLKNGEFELGFLIRSSIDSEMDKVLEQLKDHWKKPQIGESEYGIVGTGSSDSVSVKSRFPGWSADLESTGFQRTKKAIVKVLGESELKVQGVHAGLECACFMDKYPDLDCVSIGPTIRNAHSPDEKLLLSDVPKYWQILLKIADSSSLSEFEYIMCSWISYDRPSWNF